MSHSKDDFCYSQWFGKMVNFSCLHIDPFDERLVCFLACTLMPLIPPHMSTNAFNRNVHLYTSLYSSSSFSLLKNNPSQISRLLITIPPRMPYATKTITSIGKDEIQVDTNEVSNKMKNISSGSFEEICASTYDTNYSVIVLKQGLWALYLERNI